MTVERLQDSTVDRFFALSCDMLCTVGFDGGLQRVNPALERTLGQPAADLQGRPILALVHPEDRDRVAAMVQGCEPAANVEARLLGADGTYRWVEWSAQPEPEVKMIYAVGRDITERHRREANLAFLADVQEDLSRLTSAGEITRLVGARLGAYLDISLCFLADIDESRDEGRITCLWNAEGASTIPGVVLLSRFISPEFSGLARAGQTVVIRDAETEANAEAYAEFKIRSFVAVPFHKSGEWKCLLAICDRRRREWRDGEIELFEELSSRVMPRLERACAEEAGHGSAERLRKATSIETAGVLFFNLDGRITGADAAFEQMIGYSHEELLNTVHWEVLTPPEFMDVTARAAAELATRGTTAPYEKQLIRKDGSRWWGLFAPIRLSGHGSESECVEFAIDITERKRTRGALHESQERLQLALDASAMGTFIWYPEEDRTEPDARMLELFGLPNDGTLSLRSALANVIHPEDRWRYAEAVARALDRAGSGVVQEDIRVVHPDSSVRWVAVYGQVFFEGEPRRAVRMAGMANDIDKRKRAEEEREQALERAEAAVRARDEFLSIASHELRNPITAITATAQLMRRLLDRGRLDEPRLDKYTRTIHESGERLALLVNDLLDVSRLRSGQLSIQTQSADLAELVKRAVEIERIAAEGHRLRLHIEDSHTLQLDPERIRQVVVNLLDNAIKYSPTGGEVRILLTYDDDGAWLRIQDQGMGLPEDALESIFAPFGRAANAASSQIQGMGLGLYIARRIAEAHGGRLWAESEGEGHGTTQCLWLPVGIGASRQRTDVDSSHLAPRSF